MRPFFPFKTLVNQNNSSIDFDLLYMILYTTGSALEMKHSLMSFGIHCGKIFLDKQRESAKQELFHEYIQRRCAEEKTSKRLEAEEESKSGIVRCPKPEDVLIGRGTPYHEHIGNILLAQLVETRLGRYLECMDDSFGKTCISMEVVKSVQESGGRFLQKSTGEVGWKVVDYTVARQKASNVFRCKVSKIVAQPEVTGWMSHFKTRLLPPPSLQQAKRQRQDPHPPIQNRDPYVPMQQHVKYLPEGA
jgi:hypothetical protein